LGEGATDNERVGGRFDLRSAVAPPSKTKQPKSAALAFLVAISLAPTMGVMCSAALPPLSHQFDVSPATTQFVVTIFVFGYCLAQLFFGPMANKLGRVRTLVAGVVLAALGGALCGLSAYWDGGGVGLLFFGRACQGFGAGAGIVVSFVLIHESYTGADGRRILGVAFAGSAIFPALGVLVSGPLVDAWGWPTLFFVAAAYCCVVAVLCGVGLRETLPPANRKPLHLARITQGYLHAIRSRRLVLTSVVYGSKMGVLYGTVGLLPFIAKVRFDMGPTAFATAFFVSYLGYLVGASLAVFTAGRWRALRAIQVGIVATLCGGIAFGGLLLTGDLSPITAFTAVFVIFLGFPLTFSNGPAHAVEEGADAATHSAVYAFLALAIACLVVLGVGRIREDYALVLSVMTIVLMVVSVVAHRALHVADRRDRSGGSRPSAVLPSA
jgi:MFS transporter, DHA1 family, multidrug resistance protein